MTFRAKALVSAVTCGALLSLDSTRGHPAQQWLHFWVYLVAILLSSGMKVAMPKSNGTMAVNFPFILLGILELSPMQAVILAACSVLAQCRVRVVRSFTPVQILFNVANVVTATVLAWHTDAALLRIHAEAAPALAVAATVYFLANTIPVVVIIGWESGSAPFEKWRQEFLWYFPFYLVGAMLAAFANFIGDRYGWVTSLLLIPLVYIVYRAYTAQTAIIRDRERHIVEIEALHLRTIEGLSMAIEAKDANTHRHLMRVRVYVSELSKIMGLDPAITKALVTASYLHDIGKLAVPEYILNKPGKLTPQEFEKMKIHPVVGAEILERVRFPYPVVPIVRSHHEAWDGSGYPDGLKGEEIPIGARLLTVVDCLDAIASDRPYRRAMPLHEAMALVKSKAGTQFDPEIVDLLEKHYAELDALASQQIEEMAPLVTDLLIERGAAPGAGFAPEPKPQTPTPPCETAGNAGAGAEKSLFEVPSAANPNHQELLRELNRGLDASRDPRELCAALSRHLQPLLPFDCLALYLKPEEGTLTPYIDGPCAESYSAEPIPVGEGLSGWVAQSQRFIVNGNPTVEPNFRAANSVFTADSSALAVPIADASGVLLAVLTLYARRPAAFSREHLETLQGLETKLALCLQNGSGPVAVAASAARNSEMQAAREEFSAL